MANNKTKNLMNKVKLTKTKLAKSLGISRAMLYYQPKKPAKDFATKEEILAVLSANPKLFFN